MAERVPMKGEWVFFTKHFKPEKADGAKDDRFDAIVEESVALVTGEKDGVLALAVFPEGGAMKKQDVESLGAIVGGFVYRPSSYPVECVKHARHGDLFEGVWSWKPVAEMVNRPISTLTGPGTEAARPKRNPPINHHSAPQYDGLIQDLVDAIAALRDDCVVGPAEWRKTAGMVLETAEMMGWKAKET